MRDVVLVAGHQADAHAEHGALALEGGSIFVVVVIDLVVDDRRAALWRQPLGEQRVWHDAGGVFVQTEFLMTRLPPAFVPE